MLKASILLVLFITALAAKEGCLRYGIIPYTDVNRISQGYKEWESYLEKKINRCIDIKIENTYEGIIESFVHDKIDFAFVGPFSYILTKKMVAVEPIVIGLTSDKLATYRSLLVSTPQVAKELGIKSPLKGEKGMYKLKEKLLKHKKAWMLSFTDESSTSGYAVPNYYMKKTGLDPDDYFKKITFVGTHDAAQLVVAHNIIPMAFSAQMLYNQLLKDKLITKQSNIVLWESDDIPKAPIIIKKDIPEKLRKDIQKALLQLPEEKFPKFGKTVGYAKTNEAQYKIIEQINEYLKTK